MNTSPSNIFSADETYIKVKGIKHYVWIIMDACKKSILGYQVSDTRAVGPCILAMRMAFEKFNAFPGKALKFMLKGMTIDRKPPKDHLEEIGQSDVFEYMLQLVRRRFRLVNESLRKSTALF